MTTAVDGVITGFSDAGVVSHPFRRIRTHTDTVDRNIMNPTLFMLIKITQSEIECQMRMGYIYVFKARTAELQSIVVGHGRFAEVNKR